MKPRPKRRGFRFQYLERMRVQRKHPRLAANLSGHLDGTPDDALVPQMDSVERSDGENDGTSLEAKVIQLLRDSHAFILSISN